MRSQDGSRAAPVRANGILPGTIDISLYGRKGGAADRESWEPRASSHQVFGRMGSPDEMAGATCFPVVYNN